MTKAEILDNLDGVLLDISHLKDSAPTYADFQILNGMKRTLARVADAIEFSTITALPYFDNNQEAE